MSIRWLRPEPRHDSLSAEVAVLVLVDADHPAAASDVVDELKAHTHSSVPLLTVDLAEVAAAVRNEVPGLDVVLLNAACRVPPGWLERLREAARSDDTIGTATPLTSWWLPGVAPDPEADRTIAAASTRSRPRVQIGGPDCLYVRREALSLLPPPAATGVSALISSLSHAVAAAGLVNVLADDVYIEAPGQAPSPEDGLERLRAPDRGDERGAVQRVVSLATATLDGLTVTIDARSLFAAHGGTQRYTLELIDALARHTDTRVRAVVAGDDVDPGALATLQATPGVQVVTYEQAIAGVTESHIVHRPQQVFNIGDLNLLRLLGRRLVITHQDLIAYHNPTYHQDIPTWEQYRRITRLALAVADRVVMFSEHALGQVLAEDLAAADRCDVIGAAVQDATHPNAPPPAARRPAGLSDGDFILCLGADYRHKNRPFAIELVRALRAEHEWHGRLVFAGSHVPHGSSAAEEQWLLDGDPGLRHAVDDLGGVTEAERRWLLEHARAVIVPSIVEGFGLVPLEAARAGVPCLFAPVSSLREVVSPALATLVAWDVRASAIKVAPLLEEGPARRDHLQCLHEDAQRWSWERLAEQLVAAYERALRGPFGPAAPRAWQEAEREAHLVDVHAEYHTLLDRLDGRIALASDEGFLTAAEQQGLLRVGARPGLARVVLWPFSALGSIRASAH